MFQNDIQTIISYILMTIGFISIVFFSIVIIIKCIKFIIDSIQTICYKFQQRHRFKKRPIAKCYCVDCQFWNKETYECTGPFKSIQTLDTWFCKEAIPRKRKK